MVVFWIFLAGTTDDDEADSLPARHGVNNAAEMTDAVSNGIPVNGTSMDDAVADATVTNDIATNDTATSEKISLKSKKKAKKSKRSEP